MCQLAHSAKIPATKFTDLKKRKYSWLLLVRSIVLRGKRKLD